MILCVGIPGKMIYVFLIPGLIASTLRTQRKKGTLYPSQAHYDSRWTINRLVLVGYRMDTSGGRLWS